jgi:23S rRNA (guanosine2251-2'-O)-methyltransferase
MSPRFERRPEKWAGAGGRKPARPGSSTSSFRDRDKGRDRDRDRNKGREWQKGREWDKGRDRDRSAERGAGAERFPERGRPSARPGDRFRPSSRERGPERERAPGTDWNRGARDGRRDSRREPVRGVGERSGYSRTGPRREDSRPARRLLPSRFSRPPVVAVESLPQQAPQGVHADESPASDLIWGRHAAQAALESGRPVHRIWCTAEMRFSPAFLQLLREAKASGVLVEEVTWARLGQLTGGAVHQGIVLQAAAADTLDLPSLIDGCRDLGEAPLLMALDGITDPHNLGAIARSAEALGAHGLVLPQRRSAGLTGSVAKVAAGALEHLPVARVVNLNRALDSLKQEGYRVVGLAAEGTLSLEQVDLDGPLVIVTGSEGDGLSMLTRKHCDQLVSIPLRGVTPSLNASVATALLLYEVARRGWMKGLRGGDPAPRIVRPQLPSAAAPAAESLAEIDQEAMPSAEPVQHQELEAPGQPTAGPEPEAAVQAVFEPAAPQQPEPLETPQSESESVPEPGAASAFDHQPEPSVEPEPLSSEDQPVQDQPEPASEGASPPQEQLTPPAGIALGLQTPQPTGFVADVQL